MVCCFTKSLPLAERTGKSDPVIKVLQAGCMSFVFLRPFLLSSQLTALPCTQSEDDMAGLPSSSTPGLEMAVYKTLLLCRGGSSKLLGL